MDRISQPSLTGKLLISHPALRDPNFFRTVVYLVAHSPSEGAMGFVLNRPAGKRVGDFLRSAEAAFLTDMQVRWGGPVGINQLSFVVLEPSEEEEEDGSKVPQVTCKPGMSIEDLNEVMSKKDLSVYAFLGYSGWGAGQIEAEIQSRSWIVKKAEQPLFKGGLDELWKNVMCTLGPVFRIEALAPENPWVN